MRSKIGTICMLLGAVLVLAALSLFLSNRREDSTAKRAAEEVLIQMVEQIETSDETGYPNLYDPTMTETEIDGYAYVGYLSIPSLELELPVMSEWDYPRLKIAPCRYTGSTKTDDLVICAHNYASHFGVLQNLTLGDKVYFTDIDGVIWAYAVEAVDVLQPTAVEDMTAGEYDLTLFTCTYGGQTRVTVRCEYVNNSDSI